MIERKEIEDAYSGEVLESIKDALNTLGRVGFFAHLIRANQFRLVQSFESQDVEQLAKQISEARQENRVLLTLQSLYPPQ